MIRLDDVTFRYPEGDSPALDGVSLDIQEGELLLVAGPTGAGKSTLLRTTNGLVPHFSGGVLDGSITVDGHDTRTAKPRDLAAVVGFVPQDPEASSVATTVEEEVAFVLENLGTTPVLMRKRVEETLDALGIAPLRARRLETLSGGERQRVAVASVLVAAPRFLVLDEPTSQLDPQSAEEVLSAMLRLSHELGIGVILSEHRIERVAAFADRACIVQDGHANAGDPRIMLRSFEGAPPVVRLARALGWDSTPLTVREARPRVRLLEPSPVVAELPVPGDARIDARGVRAAVGGREVLRGVDLRVRAGETVAIVGRNGAGKTTLLRALIGLARRSGGEVLLDGKPRRSVEDAAGVAAFVPQSADRVLWRSRAADEIAVTLRGTNGVGDVLAEWDLEWAADRDPRDLSAGERTRLALAASLARHPGIVLLDEPTRGMDARHKAMLVLAFERWRAEGRACVVVTHDVELVAAAATRVVLLAEGEAVLDGPVREILGESLVFSSQMNKVFEDRRVATVEDALRALGVA